MPVTTLCHRLFYRASGRRAKAVLVGIAAISCAAQTSHALSINQWTGNAGDSSWGNLNNWVAGNVPNTTDQATVYSGTIQLNSTPASVGGLLLSHVGSGSFLNTNGFKLNCLGTVSIAGGILDAATISAGSFSLQAPTIAITNNGELNMFQSTSHVHVSSTSTGTPNGALTVDGTSYVLGTGTLDTGTYTNNGYLDGSSGLAVNATTFTLAGSASHIAGIAPNGTSTTINATTFELTDYNSAINLQTANSTLNLNGTIDYATGNIGADITIGDTSSLNFTIGQGLLGYYAKSGGFFVPRGNVHLYGGPTLARAAQINGGATFFTNLDVTGFASLSAPAFEGASSAAVAANGYLYLNSPYFRGLASSPSITLGGAGTILMNNDTTIGYASAGIPYTTVTVNAGTSFDWDGTNEATATCTITNGELDINTSIIDISHSIFFHPQGYYGALSITGGALLNVAGTAWTLYGTMALGPGAIVQGQTLTIDGTNLSPGAYSLTPTSSGTTFPVIQAPIVVNPNSYIYMTANGGLHLDGATNWAGGGVTSAPFVSGFPPYGMLVQNGNATVSANTTIFCAMLDMDGTANTATWTVNPGITFTQQAYFLDAAGSTTNPFHSTLTLNGGVINMQTGTSIWTLAGGTINMNQVGFNVPTVNGSQLVLGSGSTIGTINVGTNSLAQINAPLQSAAITVAGGNILNVNTSSVLYVSALSSNTNAVLTKTGPGKAYIVGAQAHSPGSQIIVSQGELDVNTDAGAGGTNLTLNASGGLTVLAITQHLFNLTVGTGAVVSVTPIVSPGTRSVIVTTLNMSGGTLDLNTNDMIARTGPLLKIFQSIQTGSSNGTWAGLGITSSSAGSDPGHLHALGSMQNQSAINQPIYPLFDNQASVITDVLVKYTYYGDATLDGKVDGSDYSRIDTAFQADQANPTQYTGWYNGDFNYDGVINGSDYTLMDNVFNRQGAQISATIAAQIAGTTSAVPEPASIATIAIASAILSGRRRNRLAMVS